MAEAQRVFDDHVRHAINLQRFNKSTIRGMLAILRKADEDLAARIQRMGDATAVDRRKQLSAIREAEDKVQRLYARRIRNDVGDLAEHEIGFQRQTLGQISVGRGTFSTVALDRVRAAALEKPFSSVHLQWAGLQDHVNELGRRRKAMIVQRIRQGFVQGESTQTIIRGLVGTRRLNFRDGLLQRPRREIEALVRTSNTHAATTARQAFYERNEDLITGVRWTAILDSRTSEICAGLDGTVFPVGEGPRPPAHPNCRSITVPILEGEEPPAFESYNAWLKRQPASVQDDVLGKTKDKLFRDGGLSVDRFTDNRNNPLTIAELKTLEKAAFDRAGLPV